MTDREREMLMVIKDLLEICRWKCSPTDEITRPDGVSNEQVMIGAIGLIQRVEGKRSEHLTRYHTGTTPGVRSNAEIRRRNGGVKHMFEDDIGGCSANYR